MTAAVNPRRRYDSSRRQARAQERRAAICVTARRLFEQNGYAQTTIADIAQAADVSPETIFKAFGSKGALLDAAVRTAVRGDGDATPLRRRPAIEAIRREPDPRRQLAMYGRVLAQVNPRLAPLIRLMREAAPGDAEARAALARLNADRLEGMGEFAALLKSRGALREGVTRREARDVLWTLNSPDLYQLLVLERGWSARRYGVWIARQLAAALLE